MRPGADTSTGRCIGGAVPAVTATYRGVRWNPMRRSRRLWLLALSLAYAVAITGCSTGEREDVRFANGPVVLAGTLLRPSGAGPHPAVVVLHGSGPDGRDNAYYDFLARAFLRRGIAVLVYDKRGVGASGGDWLRSPFSALGGDGVAALRFLRRQPRIDSSRVGVWGGSEGAVLAPEVAQSVPGTAFVVMQSATGVSFAEQNLHQTERQVRSWTTSEAEVEVAMRLQRLKHAYARTGEGWEAYARALDGARGTAWAGLGGPERPDDPWWTWYRTKMDHSPIPALEQMRIPVLAVWGANDPLVPVARSRAAVAAALRRAGNRYATLRVVEGADHSLQVDGQPEELDATAAWAAARVRMTSDVAPGVARTAEPVD